MRHFPAFHDVDARPCLLVGGGETAARKLRLLRAAGAAVTVVAPVAGPEIAALEAAGALRLRRRGFVPGDLDGQALAIAATGRDQVDRAVAEAARARGVPVNVVDRPDLSSFLVPAIVDRDTVVVAVSSGGAAPLLARKLRARIEALLPAGLGRLATFLESFRTAVRATLPEGRARLRFWEAALDGPIGAAALAGDLPRARERMIAALNGPARPGREPGLVQIVGAGPGDPDLLTLKALRALEQADVIVYDRLVGPRILDYARRDAERVFVGKAKGDHSASQDEINARLVAEARAGKRVVRLKGGDPFVFGRGGEELAHLARQGIPVEIVPGITAATGCAASAGIPLTLRGTAQAVTLVTGQAAEGEPEPDWAALARAGQTLAVYMGVSTAGRIARGLIDGGLGAATPVAVVESGTTEAERVLTGTLGGLERLVAAGGVSGPALIVIGEVAALARATELPRLAAAGAGL